MESIERSAQPNSTEKASDNAAQEILAETLKLYERYLELAHLAGPAHHQAISTWQHQPNAPLSLAITDENGDAFLE
jgi:hypothetical protein